MRKNNYIIEIITIVVCLLPIIVGVILYDKLPNEMPIHFNINNIPDNYMQKNFVLFGLPVLMAIFQLIMCIIIWFSKQKMTETPKVAKVFKWFVPILTIMLYCLTIAYTLKGFINIGKYTCLVIGILFCIIGNYLPKMNYEGNKFFIYPRPKNEKDFRKMTKIMGY